MEYGNAKWKTQSADHIAANNSNASGSYTSAGWIGFNDSIEALGDTNPIVNVVRGVDGKSALYNTTTHKWYNWDKDTLSWVENDFGEYVRSEIVNQILKSPGMTAAEWVYINGNDLKTSVIAYANTAKKAAEDAQAVMLQGGIVGALIYWTTETPTAENAPANEWTNDELKEYHIGSLCCNKTNGYMYVWEKETVDGADVWKWNRFQNSDETEALSQIRTLQDGLQAAVTDYTGKISTVTQKAESIEADLTSYKTTVSNTYKTESQVNALIGASTQSGGAVYMALNSLQQTIENKGYQDTSGVNGLISASINNSDGSIYSELTKYEKTANLAGDVKSSLGLQSGQSLMDVVSAGIETSTASGGSIYQFVTNTTTPISDELKAKNGVHSGSHAPTLSNAPANTWAEEKYPDHVDDIYYDVRNGHAYRFSYEDNLPSITNLPGSDNLPMASGKKRYCWKRVVEQDVVIVGTYIEQLVDKITLAATSETGTTSISINGREHQIDLTGLVRFKSLSTPGETLIDGANIKTGTITADTVSTGTLSSVDGMLKVNLDSSVLSITGDYEYYSEQIEGHTISGTGTASINGGSLNFDGTETDTSGTSRRVLLHVSPSSITFATGSEENTGTEIDASSIFTDHMYIDDFIDVENIEVENIKPGSATGRTAVEAPISTTGSTATMGTGTLYWKKSSGVYYLCGVGVE